MEGYNFGAFSYDDDPSPDKLKFGNFILLFDKGVFGSASETNSSGTLRLPLLL